MRDLKRFTQAYLACVTAVDDNIGQVVNAIDKSSSKTTQSLFLLVTMDGPWEKKSCIQKFTLGREHKSSVNN